MARIWKEAFDSTKHGELLDVPSDALDQLQRHRGAPTLIPQDVVFVSVCSFTFRFYSKLQLEEVLQYYEQKLVPSGREPEAVWSLRGGSHSEAERWFEKLPMYLREEPKRLKVVQALREALAMF